MEYGSVARLTVRRRPSVGRTNHNVCASGSSTSWQASAHEAGDSGARGTRRIGGRTSTHRTSQPDAEYGVAWFDGGRKVAGAWGGNKLQRARTVPRELYSL